MEGILLIRFWLHRRIFLSLLILVFVLPQALAGLERRLVSDLQMSSQGVELEPLPTPVSESGELPSSLPSYSTTGCQASARAWSPLQFYTKPSGLAGQVDMSAAGAQSRLFCYQNDLAVLVELYGMQTELSGSLPHSMLPRSALSQLWLQWLGDSQNALRFGIGTDLWVDHHPSFMGKVLPLGDLWWPVVLRSGLLLYHESFWEYAIQDGGDALILRISGGQPAFVSEQGVQKSFTMVWKSALGRDKNQRLFLYGRWGQYDGVAADSAREERWGAWWSYQAENWLGSISFMHHRTGVDGLLNLRNHVQAEWGTPPPLLWGVPVTGWGGQVMEGSLAEFVFRWRKSWLYSYARTKPAANLSAIEYDSQWLAWPWAWTEGAELWFFLQSQKRYGDTSLSPDGLESRLGLILHIYFDEGSLTRSMSEWSPPQKNSPR